MSMFSVWAANVLESALLGKLFLAIAAWLYQK